MNIKKGDKLISFILTLVIVFSSVYIPPKTAEAQSAGGAAVAIAECFGFSISDLIGSLFSGSSGDQVPTDNVKGNTKECIDGLARLAATYIIEEITDDVVDWINSGFDGNPAFIDDYEGFLTDIADEQIGAFIESSELSFLCSPFELEIRKALTISRQRGSGGRFERDISCKLSDISENVENFLNGDFDDGGWDAWRTLAEDNIYSQYIRVSLELEGRRLGALEKEKDIVNWGSGFLSYEECPLQTTGKSLGDQNGSFGDYEEGEGKYNQANCEIVTPGSVINDQLNKVLPTGLNQLELADEWNEVIAAAFNYLITEALTEGLKNI